MTSEARRLEIWRAHRVTLIESVTPIVGDRGSAEDVVQEAWVRFNGSLEKDQAGRITHLVGYLYRITRNLALDIARSRTVQRRIEIADVPDVEAIASDAPLAEQAAIDRDLLDHVARAMATLPERTRIAFEMYRFGGLTLQAIAARLNISVGLAHHLIKQAVAHCAQAIADKAP